MEQNLPNYITQAPTHPIRIYDASRLHATVVVFFIFRLSSLSSMAHSAVVFFSRIQAQVSSHGLCFSSSSHIEAKIRGNAKGNAVVVGISIH